jgi:hypothetical protein
MARKSSPVRVVAQPTTAERRIALRAAAEGTQIEERAADRPTPQLPAAHRSQPRQAPYFVSYARKDLEVARALVEAMRAAGDAVTWDQDIDAGKDFRRTIAELIRAAPAVVVIWSPESAESRFVVDEAGLALGDDKLVTTSVEGLDLRRVPLGFGSLNVVPVHDVAKVREALRRRAAAPVEA